MRLGAKCVGSVGVRLLHSVCSRGGVLEDCELRSTESEEDKEQGDDAKDDECRLRCAAGALLLAELLRFVNVCDCCGNEEDCDIQPIGRLSYASVIGIKNDRNQGESQKNSFLLDAPKILPFLKEKALYGGINKHWPKQ